MVEPTGHSACSTHLCPYGGAHEQQALDNSGVGLTPLLQLCFSVRARMFLVPQLFEESVVRHGGCVECREAFRGEEQVISRCLNDTN